MTGDSAAQDQSRGLVATDILGARLGMRTFSLFLILATGGIYLPLAAARAERLDVERYSFRGIALRSGASTGRYLPGAFLVLGPVWAAMAIFGFESDLYGVFASRPAATILFLLVAWISVSTGLLLLRRQRRTAFSRARWLNFTPTLAPRPTLGAEASAALEAVLTSRLAADPALQRALGEERFGLAPDGRVIPASLVLRGDCMALVDDKAKRAVTYADRRRVTSPVIAQARESLQFGDGSIFVARGGQAAMSRLPSRLAWAEAFHPRLLIWIAASLAMLCALSLLVVPAALRMAVALTPFSVEDELSVATMASMDAAVFEATGTSPERQSAISETFADLVHAYGQRHDARPDPSFGILFRDSDILGANAIALPSGQIVITDDFLDLVRDDEAIAAVLAHEIGHVHHRHSLYKLYRGLAVQGVSALLGGDMSRVVERGLIQAAFLGNLASSRAMEREADVLSVELTMQAGIPPEKLTEALNVLMDACGDCEEPTWLSTHPTLEDRTGRIDRMIKDR